MFGIPECTERVRAVVQVVVEQSAVSEADKEHVTALGQDTVIEVPERGQRVVKHLLRRGHGVEVVVTVAYICSEVY